MACGIQPSTFVMAGEYSGRSASNFPLTFGLGLRKGDFSGGSITPYWGGVAQPAQVNVLRSHSDGTDRHLMVTFMVPSIAANVVERVARSGTAGWRVVGAALAARRIRAMAGTRMCDCATGIEGSAGAMFRDVTDGPGPNRRCGYCREVVADGSRRAKRKSHTRS